MMTKLAQELVDFVGAKLAQGIIDFVMAKLIFADLLEAIVLSRCNRKSPEFSIIEVNKLYSVRSLFLLSSGAFAPILVFF